MHIEAALTMIHWFYACFLGILGLAMGSFLNVVAYRVPHGISIVHPPSTCPSCGKRIPAGDNVPVIGWLRLGGKCRNCRAPIPPRYILVELATGLLWAAVGWRLAALQYGFWTNVCLGLVGLAFVSALVVTFLVDWDFQIILDEISLGGLAVAVAASAFLPMLHHAGTPGEFALRHRMLASLIGDGPAWLRSLSASLAGALVGFAFSMIIYYLATAAFRKQIEEARKDDPEIDSALGLGDVKLMTFFGALLGWQAVFFIFLAGSSLGAIVGSAIKVFSGDAGGRTGLGGLLERWRNGDSVIPFGPFLAAAAGIYFFYGEEVMVMLAAGGGRSLG